MAVPRCAALRRDGQPCGALAATPEAEFCRHHERLVELHGEEAVRAGDHPRRRNPRSSEPVMLGEALVPSAEGNGLIGPAEVRPALARAAADSLDEIQRSLLDAAVGSTRETLGLDHLPRLREEAARRGQSPLGRPPLTSLPRAHARNSKVSH
jgi:hypothetical protein